MTFFAREKMSHSADHDDRLWTLAVFEKGKPFR